MTGASHLLPVPAALALLLAGAHFWRAGYPALSVFCGLLALLSWTRGAWVRQVLLLVLPLLAARWIWSAGQFVQLRQFMDQPWHRLAAILLGVALFTALGDPAAAERQGAGAVRAQCGHGTSPGRSAGPDHSASCRGLCPFAGDFFSGAFSARLGSGAGLSRGPLGRLGGRQAGGQTRRP